MSDYSEKKAEAEWRDYVRDRAGDDIQKIWKACCSGGGPYNDPAKEKASALRVIESVLESYFTPSQALRFAAEWAEKNAVAFHEQGEVVDAIRAEADRLEKEDD